MTFNIETSAYSDAGDVRKVNQDCIFSQTGVMGGHSVGLFIVADGCGGMAHGEKISGLVVSYFSYAWDNQLKTVLAKRKIKKSDIEEFLENSVKEINASAVSFSMSVGSRVGSTMSLLLAVDDDYYIKNVGDSRVYLVRENTIAQLTEDQSLVADMVRRGEISPEEARNFKKKNILTMCIGAYETIQTYSCDGKIREGDSFLVCCDGVYNQLLPEQLAYIVKDEGICFADKARYVRFAIESGRANDNVSAVICRFTKAEKAENTKLLIAMIIAVLAVSAVLFVKFILPTILNM